MTRYYIANMASKAKGPGFRRRGVLGLVLALVAISLTVTLSMKLASSQGPPPTLPSVAADRLAANGITLADPGTARPAVSREAAEAAAHAALPYSPVKATVLAQVHDDHAIPKMDKLCWVVDITPDGGFPPPAGPRSSAGQRETYLLVFVDAETGKALFARYG